MTEEEFDDWFKEEEEEPHVSTPAPKGLEAEWVRVSETKWAAVGRDGLDIITGEQPVAWTPPDTPPEPKITKRAPKQKRNKLSERVNRRLGITDLSATGNPDAELWCDREPLASYQWARTAYITSQHTMKEIAEHTGWPHYKIQFWANVSAKCRPSWASEKRIEQNRILNGVLKNTKEQCVQVIKNTLDVIDKAVSAIDDERAISMSPKDISLMVGVAVELHKVSRLESGDPTNIIGRAKLTKQSVLEKLKAADIISYEPSEEERDKAN